MDKRMETSTMGYIGLRKLDFKGLGLQVGGSIRKALLKSIG